MYNFHDATFVGCNLNWEEGTLILSFELVEPKNRVVSLIVKDLISFNCTRQLPWGMSVSVNTVNINNNDNKITTAVIEMQTGDNINVEAGYINIEA